MKKLLYILFAAISFSSCGPNAQEKAAQQKAHDDSVSVSTAAQTKSREDRRHGLQDDIQKGTEMKAQLESNLMNAKAQLDVEHSKMNSIQSYQLLRTADEKAEQVRQQSLVIQNLENNIQNLQTNITELANKLKEAEVELNSLN